MRKLKIVTVVKCELLRKNLVAVLWDRYVKFFEN
jgi:hypothetical protein